MTTTDDARDGVPISTPLLRLGTAQLPRSYDLETPPAPKGGKRCTPTTTGSREPPGGRLRQDLVRNSLHYPEVSYPFDQVTIDGAFTGTASPTPAFFALPPAKGPRRAGYQWVHLHERHSDP